MRVGIVGAGPAGLYLAILLKRAQPDHDVAVVERNPPDATYGWGVVFSEETLTELRDADYESFVAFDEALVRWNAIDIRFRGETVRSRGHGFSAVARVELLGLLQQRARQLGVELRFNEEVDGHEVFADRDLIVGADGVNSVVRRAHEPAFGTRFEQHASRFVWFGTDLVFDVFTFIFRDTEHGLFQVHAYPFDGQRSTFIVECAEDVWQRAGLDRMSEDDSLAFCQALFADDLGGRKLLSNRSLWTRFLTVRNRSWHHGKVVLVGDAAHTAHFTIGSGTKLAMEDAAALSKAFLAHPGDLEAAFADYELERMGAIERFQTAAADSAAYFETVRRYLGFAPEQFAFNLLTRSGRITHRRLELRDPALVNRVERWYSSAATGASADGRRIVSSPPRLAPLALPGRTLANRVVLAPAPTDAAEDGVPGRAVGAVLADAAAAGPGLVVTEQVAASADGRVTSGSPGLYRDEDTGAWRAVLELVRESGPAAVAVRLGHAGRRGATRPRRLGLDRPFARGWPLLAPSALAYGRRGPVPRAMDRAAMDRVLDDYVAATARSAAAGFDLLLLDLADGYLLASFLSPLANQRDDAYGGDPERRLAYPLEVFRAVRAAWPEDRPLGVRLNTDDRVARGTTPDEAVAAARALVEAGCDLVDVVAGHTVPVSPAEYRRGYMVGLADRVRNEAGVATIASGALTTLDDVDTVLAAGRADLCVLDPLLYWSKDRRTT